MPDGRARPTSKSRRGGVHEQFYTPDAVAQLCLDRTRKYVDFDRSMFIDPSAGKGAFFYKLPEDRRRGIDIDPKGPGIEKANFFDVELDCGMPTVVVGNPPFGFAGQKAIAFINRCAPWADFVCFILPRVFRKAEIQNKIARNMHLVADWDLPSITFEVDSGFHKVPTVFQIWQRRDDYRALLPTETRHSEFEFLKPEDRHKANFSMRRVGSKAGHTSLDLTGSPSTTYFIRAIGRQATHVRIQMDYSALDEVVDCTTGPRSISMAEIVRLYDRVDEELHWTPAPGEWPD